MKLSLRGEYALRALVVLGQNYGPEVVRIQSISDQQNIPKRFLEQILSDLKSAQIVESKRGVAGGYRLAKPPEERSSWPSSCATLKEPSRPSVASARDLPEMHLPGRIDLRHPRRDERGAGSDR